MTRGESGRPSPIAGYIWRLSKPHKRQFLAHNLFSHGLRLLVFVCICVLLSACDKEPKEPIKLGTNVWLGYEPLYLARDLGYFTADDTVLVEYSSASQVMRSFRNGSIDMAALTLDEVLSLVHEGFTPQIILVFDISTGADSIISHSHISAFSQLKGKRVGYENTAVGAYLLSRALQVNQMDTADVELIPMEIHEAESAFNSEKVDAVVAFEPVRSRLLALGAKEIFSSRNIPNEIVDVLVVRTKVLDNNTNRISRLIRSWYKSLEYMRVNKTEAIQIMNKRQNMPIANYEVALKGITFPNETENEQLLGLSGKAPELLETAKRLANVMVGHKLLAHQVELNNLFPGKANYLQK